MCVHVWHPALTKEQMQSLINVQLRALQIISGNSPCDLSFGTHQMSSLCDKLHELCDSLFRQIVRDESHVLHDLLQEKLDSLFTERLRSE